MRIPRALGVGVVLVVSAGCSSSGDDNAACTSGAGCEKTLTVAAYLQPCETLFLGACMTEHGDTGTGLYDYEGIEKFSFEWGYEADLVIKETTISNPPADGSSLRQELVKVEDRRTTVGNTFRLQLAPVATSAESLSQILSGSCDTGYTLFPSVAPKALVFDAGLSCESFAAALTSDVPSALELRFSKPNEGLSVLSLIP